MRVSSTLSYAVTRVALQSTIPCTGPPAIISHDQKWEAKKKGHQQMSTDDLMYDGSPGEVVLGTAWRSDVRELQLMLRHDCGVLGYDHRYRTVFITRSGLRLISIGTSRGENTPWRSIDFFQTILAISDFDGLVRAGSAGERNVCDNPTAVQVGGCLECSLISSLYVACHANSLSANLLGRTQVELGRRIRRRAPACQN